MTQRRSEQNPHSMLWFAKDLPNLISLLGLASALLGIYCAVIGLFPGAMIALIWAVVFDWLDGRVARKMKGRSKEQREYGAHLDSLIDIVSFGIAPAVLLLAVGGFHPRFLLGAFVVLAAAAIRLAYFNTFGLADSSTYRGMALDNNIIILVALFAFQPLVPELTFASILFTLLMVLSILNVAPMRTPKFDGNWYYVLVTYAVGASVLFGWQLLAAFA